MLQSPKNDGEFQKIKKVCKSHVFSEKYFKFMSIYNKLQIFEFLKKIIKNAWNILEL